MGKKFYSLIYCLLICSFAFAQSATVKGIISSDVTNTALEGAVIHFDDFNNGIVTNEKGQFIFQNVTPGAYKVKVKLLGYEKTEQKIVLAPGQVLVLNFRLKPTSENLSTVNVYGKLNKESEASGRSSERNANNITNVVTAKVMERSPDINAANVLSRVSGVTIQRNTGGDEAYAIIRGLDPRYNNTLINGVKVTSPDEKSRYVSLDLVPSDLLQRIEVSKTLLPEMEGDAIGGTVNLVFKDAPDSMLFKASAQAGYSQIFLDRKYTTFPKQDIQQNSPAGRYGQGYSAVPNDFSRSNLDFRSATAPPSTVTGITYGRRFFGGKLGLIVADNFQNQYYGTNAVFNPVVPLPQDGFKPGITDYSNLTYSNQQLNNGLALHADYKINDRNQLIINNVLLYSYLAQARLSIDTSIIGGNGGRLGPGTGSVVDDNRSLTQKELLENLKLEGKHILTKHLLFDWAGVFSTSSKKVPDEATISTDHLVNPDHTSSPYYFDNIDRLWQHNNDRDYNGLANLTYKGYFKSIPFELKAGGLYRHKQRYNSQDDYTLRPDTNGSGGKQQFNNIYTAQWTVYNAKGTAGYDVNDYRAFENITAGYAEFKISFPRLDIFGGVREEHTSQGYDYVTFIPTLENNIRKNYTDVLPSLQLNFKLTDKSNLRASYFSSISRPNYYELVPYTIQGVSGVNEMGNPNLKHATADNYDLRYELYPKNDEELFVSAFYKTLYNPIELELTGFGGGNITYTPTNIAPQAKIEGAELVYTKYFGVMGISANYAYIYSNVKSLKVVPDSVGPGNNTITRLQSRPLQGQTDNSLNASLLYRDKKNGVFVQLAYQYLGKTLSQVYANYGYDYYQQPQSFLALSGEKNINRHFTLFGKFNNLLNTPTTIKINNLTVGQNIYKANYNIGIRYSN